MYHGDIKTANVLLKAGRLPDGSPSGTLDPTSTKLCDFGSAAGERHGPPRPGTAQYAPPEVLLEPEPEHPIDRRAADQFSCGVVLFEVLAGHSGEAQPWGGKSAAEIVELVKTADTSKSLLEMFDFAGDLEDTLGSGAAVVTAACAPLLGIVQRCTAYAPGARPGDDFKTIVPLPFRVAQSAVQAAWKRPTGTSDYNPAQNGGKSHQQFLQYIYREYKRCGGVLNASAAACVGANLRYPDKGKLLRLLRSGMNAIAKQQKLISAKDMASMLSRNLLEMFAQVHVRANDPNPAHPTNWPKVKNNKTGALTDDTKATVGKFIYHRRANGSYTLSAAMRGQKMQPLNDIGIRCSHPTKYLASPIQWPDVGRAATLLFSIFDALAL